MDRRELSGRVEIDDAYLGSELSGGKAGRGSENKVPFVAAVRHRRRQGQREAAAVQGHQHLAGQPQELDKLPAGAGSSMLHVVGGDMGGGFEWQTAPAYRTTVRRGITAIALDPESKVSRLTTVWDGAMLPLDEIKALVALSIE